MNEGWVAAALRDARVARLATTAGAGGIVRLVPICFAIVDDGIVSAVDHKPKRTERLRRLDDIASSGVATVLVDHYDEDWTQLWWVRVRGRATVHTVADDPAAATAIEALVAKYPQYQEVRPSGAVYRIAIDDVRSWRASAEE